MFGIGMPEMCVILAIMLIVVGPGKIPQIGQALGSSIRNFKKAATEEPTKLPEQ
jgi:sec-independent protein translocase protein TatA